METKMTETQKQAFTTISYLCGEICKDAGICSEKGGAYDLARHIQLAIYNVFEEDGTMIWN
jgi:hypothetical protein